MSPRLQATRAARDRRAITALFLTNNPNLGSTARVLQGWLRLGPDRGLGGVVVGRAEGPLIDWIRRRGVPCLVDPMPWFDRRRPWTALTHAVRVAHFARAHRVDLIHCNEHDLYPFARLLRVLLRRPVVCYVRYRIDRHFAQWAFGGSRRPDRLLWTSQQQQSDSGPAVADLVPSSDQHVIHLAVDTQEFEEDPTGGRQFRHDHGIEDDAVVVGTASPLRPRKRVEDFVSLIRQLADRHPALVGLIAGPEIAGDEGYRARIETEIAASGLGARLRWLGNLEPIHPFHAACDISVSTSAYETFGNSVCEAMASATPVVAYAGGSVQEVIGEAGVVVDTGDLGSLVTAVDSLVVDDRRRRAIGRAGRVRVRDAFGAERNLEDLLQVYRQVVAPRR